MNAIFNNKNYDKWTCYFERYFRILWHILKNSTVYANKKNLSLAYKNKYQKPWPADNFKKYKTKYILKNRDILENSRCESKQDKYMRLIFRLSDDDFVIKLKYYSLIYLSCFDSYLEFSKMSLFFGICFIRINMYGKSSHKWTCCQVLAVMFQRRFYILMKRVWLHEHLSSLSWEIRNARVLPLMYFVYRKIWEFELILL